MECPLDILSIDNCDKQNYPKQIAKVWNKQPFDKLPGAWLFPSAATVNYILIVWLTVSNSKHLVPRIIISGLILISMKLKSKEMKIGRLFLLCRFEVQSALLDNVQAHHHPDNAINFALDNSTAGSHYLLFWLWLFNCAYGESDFWYSSSKYDFRLLP